MAFRQSPHPAHLRYNVSIAIRVSFSPKQSRKETMTEKTKTDLEKDIYKDIDKGIAMNTEMNTEMNEVERYLFDLQGYLVVQDALSKEEVAELNRLIDAQNLPEPSLDVTKASFANYLSWGKAFCDLLDHAQLMPRLTTILGDGFRLDHYYGIHLRAGTAPLRLHGGNTPYDPPEYYHFRNGQMINGLVVVSWNLADSGGELGGFCCIPGSHKANYPCPPAIQQAHASADCVVIPEARAGSLVIFTEALTHGTAAWRGQHHRRSLLYKYSPGQQSWAKEYLRPPSNVTLTARQALLFEPPYYNKRASLFDHDEVGS